MPGFPKPTVQYSYVIQDEIQHIRDYRDNEAGRQIPSKRNDRLLIATWNIANLGVHDRRLSDYQLIAEMVSWFDIIALQEVNDDLSGLRSVLDLLLTKYYVIFTDKAGNDERMTFLYDSSKVSLMELAGEIAVPPKDHKHIHLPGNTSKFVGFDRNPFVVAFNCHNYKVMLVNSHLYFGDDTSQDRERRSLEAYAISRWADLRRKSSNSYCVKIIVLGDFNLPKVEPGDPVYKALRRRGLRRPEHSTKIASNIANDSDYDQIMFFPGQVGNDYTGTTGIFDFDGALFPDLYNSKGLIVYRAYLRYYISDHRILWAEFRI